MRKSILFLLITIIGTICYGQQFDSLRYKYNNLTITRYGINSFMKGSERISFKDLSKEFEMSELGLISFTKAKQYKKISTIFRIVSLATGLAALGVIANNGNRNTYWGLVGGQFALSIGATRFTSLSVQSLDRALWQRNKDLLFPERE